MPIVYRKDFNLGWLALWQITESVEQLCEMVSEADARRSSTFSSLSRRREWLAWRAIVAELLGGAEVAYNSVGAPLLVDYKGFIGVSHEKEFVAVIYSQVGKCAVDIESLDRNFDRVLSRYISDNEALSLKANHPHFKAAVWCAKEVIYKSAGEVGLDLIADIEVNCDGIDQGEVVAGIIGRKSVHLSLFTYENRLVVYTLLN